MDTNDSDTFSEPLTFSNSAHTVCAPDEGSCDIITVLAAVQDLKVDVLSMTWESARLQVGRGRTSHVNQTSLAAHTSFAFKRYSRNRASEDIESHVWRTMTNEIRILCHSAIKTDPNVITLQGICWEFGSADEIDQPEQSVSAKSTTGADRVWPVLVFEKSQFGDLYHFLATEIGKELAVEARLILAKQIVQAVLHMHSQGIIHGDIKPENVLVFRDKEGKFCAKLADFGFSTWYANEDDYLVLPRTVPWHAPEHTFSGIHLAQARRMDCFSTALLLLWLIGQPYLLHHEAVVELRLQMRTQEIYRDPVLRYLEECKDRGNLVKLAREVLAAENDLDLEMSANLMEFFAGGLMSSPNLRDISMKMFEKVLGDQQETAKPMNPLRDTSGTSVNTFEVVELMYQLYRGDYRLRKHITDALKHRVLMNPKSPLALQLSLCLQLGFGCTRDERLAEDVLVRSGMKASDVRDRLDTLKETPHWGGPVTIFRRLSWDSVLNDMITAEYYSQQNCLEEAELVLRRDLSALEHVFDETHVLVSAARRILRNFLIFLKNWAEVESLNAKVISAWKKLPGTQYETLMAEVMMATIYKNQGRLLEAEELQAQSLQTWQYSYSAAFGEDHPDLVSIIAGLASIYSLRERWTEAEQLQSEAVRKTKQMYGEDHPKTLRSMSILATTLMRQQKWPETRNLRMRIMQISKRALGSDDLITLHNQSELAVLVLQQGRWSEAEEILGEVLRQKGQIFGHDHPQLLSIKSNLASVYAKQGRWAEAEELQKEETESSKAILGERHPDTIVNLGNLAQMYAGQQRWTEAESLQIRVVELNKEILGESHSTTLHTIANLSTIYMDRGRWTDAEKLQQHVVQTSHQALGSDHTDTLFHMSNLAQIHAKQGRLMQAEQVHFEVLQKRRQILGDHPETLGSMGNLATVYAQQGKFHEAELLQVEVVQNQKLRFGADHPDVIGSILNLAVMYAEQGRHTEAEQVLLRLLETSSIALGAEHTTTLHIKNRLAATYQDQERWSEAELLQVEVMEKRHRILGPNHPDTLSSMSDLAETYARQGLWEKTEPLRVQVLQKRQQVLEHDHPDVRFGLAKLAFTYANQGKWDEAAPLQLQASQMFQQAFGPDHPNTTKSMSNLAVIYEHQGRRKEANQILEQAKSYSVYSALTSKSTVGSFFSTMASRLGILKAGAEQKG